MDVSIIIVNYNTKELLKNCLNSILKYSIRIRYEIIVIDNASTDGSQQLIRDGFPQIKLIENKENVGFGKANNHGVKIAFGKYLFFLNPDCVLLNNAVEIFFEFMENNNQEGNIGAVGGMLLNNDLQLNSSYQKFPKMFETIYSIILYYLNKTLKLSLRRPERINYSIDDSPYFEVEFIVGADLFVPINVFKDLNGFNDDFFLYFEETDLQKRMANKGLKRFIIRDSKIIHFEGSSTKKKPDSLKSIVLYNHSMLRYFKNNYPLFQYFMFIIFITPLLSFPILKSKNSLKVKSEYFRMLLSKT
jgi:GT2 family glycosyltransferase